MVDHLTSLLYVLLPWNWKTESEDVSIFAASRDQPISSGSNRFAAIAGRTGFAQDSSLEQAGFEPSVPLGRERPKRSNEAVSVQITIAPSGARGLAAARLCSPSLSSLRRVVRCAKHIYI